MSAALGTACCSGWWLGHPSEKYESQLGWLFPICGKIKNVPNHQPVFFRIWNHPVRIDQLWTRICIWGGVIKRCLLENSPFSGWFSERTKAPCRVFPNGHVWFPQGIFSNISPTPSEATGSLLSRTVLTFDPLWFGKIIYKTSGNFLKSKSSILMGCSIVTNFIWAHPQLLKPPFNMGCVWFMAIDFGNQRSNMYIIPVVPHKAVAEVSWVSELVS